MSDMFMEMIKSLSISKEEMTKRFTIIDQHTFKELQAKNKSIIVLMGHYASYEWAIAAQFVMDFPIVGVYKKIKNKYFDQLAHRIRGKFNTRLIDNHNVCVYFFVFEYIVFLLFCYYHYDKRLFHQSYLSYAIFFL